MSYELQNKQPGKLSEFLSQHAVFTITELDAFLATRGSGNPSTRKSLLAYYLNKGRIVRVRRGLYAPVPLGIDPVSCPVDPYLVAAKMVEDAVLAYHTALEFHGKAYSLFTRLFYLSSRKSLPLDFQSHTFRCVPVPRALRSAGKQMFGVTSRKSNGVELKVTTLERTLVDVMDRPDLSGSWEEIWRSLESIEFFDLDQVVKYALMIKNATTVAKGGFFLEQHSATLMVEKSHLSPLREFIPRQPHYLERADRRGCRWNKNWNLMIPVEILDRSWGEVL